MKKIASLSLEKFSKFCEIFPRDADENANWKSYFDLNNNNQWDAGEPLYDDVGTDGIGPFDANYSGPDNDGTEANGKPDQGEPNFGILDKDYVEVIAKTCQATDNQFIKDVEQLLDKRGHPYYAFNAEFDMAHRGVALDVVQGAEQIGDQCLVIRIALQPNDVALYVGNLVDQRIDKFP